MKNSLLSTQASPATSITPHAWVYLHTANLILNLIAILQAYFISCIKQKKLTNELSAALNGLKKAIVANAETLAKGIGEEEGGDKEHELVDGVLVLEGVGRELGTWGFESGVEAVRAIRKSLAADIVGVGKGKLVDFLGVGNVLLGWIRWRGGEAD